MGDQPVVDVAQLVAEHHVVLYRYAYRLTGSVADAEDLVQQTFLLAQAKLGQLRDAESARAWLFAILRNCFRQSIRQRPPVPTAQLDERVEAPAVGTWDEGVEIDQERLQAALDRLPEEFRVVLLMYYFEQISYRDIADRLELPIGTVMSRLSRAKEHLRGKLFARELHGSASSQGTDR